MSSCVYNIRKDAAYFGRKTVRTDMESLCPYTRNIPCFLRIQVRGQLSGGSGCSTSRHSTARRRGQQRHEHPSRAPNGNGTGEWRER